MKFVFNLTLVLFAKLALVEYMRVAASANITTVPYTTHHKFTTKFNGINNREIRCTGALISLKAIITTAKCARIRDLSKYSIFTGQDVYGVGTAIVPTNIHTNPSYDVSTLENNMAIFIIPAQTASDKIKPVKLPTGSEAYANNVVNLAGFGRYSSVDPPNDELEFTTNTVVCNDHCSINPYNPNSGVPKPKFEQARQYDLCTASPSTPGGDTCSGGDEGSALTIPSNPVGEFIMVGIFNFNAGDGNCESEYFSVSVRVSEHVVWIYGILDANR